MQSNPITSQRPAHGLVIWTTDAAAHESLVRDTHNAEKDQDYSPELLHQSNAPSSVFAAIICLIHHAVGSDAQGRVESMRPARNPAAPATPFKTDKRFRLVGPQQRTKALRCRPKRRGRGCEAASRTRRLLSDETESSSALPCQQASN